MLIKTDIRLIQLILYDRSVCVVATAPITTYKINQCNSKFIENK